MSAAELTAFAQFVAGRIGDALPVMLGGAGGVLLVWWLDSRRDRARERRELSGALELTCLELSANVASMQMSLSNAGIVPPIELHKEAWPAVQLILARGLPRDAIGRLGASYYLLEMFLRNYRIARERGVVTGDTVGVAEQVRDSEQASLRELQAFMRKKLGIQFTIEPAGPAEAGAAQSE